MKNVMIFFILINLNKVDGQNSKEYKDVPAFDLNTHDHKYTKKVLVFQIRKNKDLLFDESLMKMLFYFCNYLAL